MNLGNENVILGLPWLKDVNPSIDWTNKTISVKDPLTSHKNSSSRSPLIPNATNPTSLDPLSNPHDTLT